MKKLTAKLISISLTAIMLMPGQLVYGASPAGVRAFDAQTLDAQALDAQLLEARAFEAQVLEEEAALAQSVEITPQEEDEVETAKDAGETAKDDADETAKDDAGEIAKDDADETVKDDTGEIVKDDAGETVKEDAEDTKEDVTEEIAADGENELPLEGDEEETADLDYIESEGEDIIDRNEQPLTQGIRFTVALKKASCGYTGYQNTPAFTVICNYQSYDSAGNRNGLAKKQVLVENVDYITRYENNVHAGTGKAYAIGIGDYRFTYEREFTIFKKLAKSVKFQKIVRPVYISDAEDGDVLALLKKSIPLYDGARIVDPDDYELIPDRVNLTEPGKVKLSVKLNPEGNYTGNVKSTVTVNLEESSETETPVEVTLKVPTKTYTYTGGEIKPVVLVKEEGKVVSGKEYFIGYENNINAGSDAKVIVYGKGKRKGILGEVTFEILPKEIKTLRVMKMAPIPYRDDVSAIKPKIMLGKETLIKGEDFEVELVQNGTDLKSQVIAANKANGTMIIRPSENNPNFTDSSGEGLKATYVLTKRKIGSGLLVKAVGNVVKDPALVAAATPNLTITYDEELLTKGTDYRVKYQKQINGKDGRVSIIATVTGTGIYTGQKVVRWVMCQSL